MAFICFSFRSGDPDTEAVCFEPLEHALVLITVGICVDTLTMALVFLPEPLVHSAAAPFHYTIARLVLAVVSPFVLTVNIATSASPHLLACKHSLEPRRLRLLVIKLFLQYLDVIKRSNLAPAQIRYNFSVIACWSLRFT